MATTITLAELRRRDVALEPHEAVAIVQRLMQTSADDDRNLEPPFGLPSAETVAIDADGAVCCSSSAMTLSVQEGAIVLQQLIQLAERRVPGGLRYAIGRALHDVEAPPFDSVSEFSQALERFEQGDRTSVIVALHARAAAAVAGISSSCAFTGPNERRRHMPSVSEVRRQLRDADLRMYQMHQLANGARMPRTSRGLRAPVAACMLAGVVLVAAGELARAGMPLPATIATAGDVRSDGAVRTEGPARAETTLTARTSDIALPVKQPSLPRAAEARETAVPRAAGSGLHRPASAPAVQARTRRRSNEAGASEVRRERASEQRRAAARDRDANGQRAAAQNARAHASRPAQDDDGALLRIRFEWNNPFK
jgi:hypothetical protein